MRATRAQVERAFDTQDSAVVAALLYGPDEATSNALAGRLAKAMGADAERIDLDGAELKVDPARLADEAAAFSMFASKKWLRVSGGDEVVPALDALLDLPSTGNPVVIIASALPKTSALVKRALEHPAVLALASYVPDAADAVRMVIALGREHGLQIDAPVARRIVEANGSDRAVIGQEIAKFALYLDAEPGRVATLEVGTLDALAADSAEGDVNALVNHVMDGRAGAVNDDLARIGGEGVRILNALGARVLLLARLRAEVDGGNALRQVMETAGRAIFWKD
ncbi:MAG: DNA polymerase III subunit delta, partial [Alphaproteobacteria bacterium]|nr:DNA polymerase III subunit delta [Alphaproteobacteria bacterium]